MEDYGGEKIGNFHGAAAPIEIVIGKSAQSNKMPRITPFSHNGTWEKGAFYDNIFLTVRQIRMLLPQEKGGAYMTDPVFCEYSHLYVWESGS